MTEPSGLGDVIASQVRKYRLLRNWSVRQLAQECERLGAPQLTAPSLANIERGQMEGAKRAGRRVLVEELAVLAKALKVPPIVLMFPLTRDELIEVLPGEAVPGWSAMKWWTAEEPFPTLLGGTWGATEEDMRDWEAASAPVIYRRVHDQLVAKWLGGDEEAKREVEEKLPELRQNMRRAGVDPGGPPSFLAE